MKAERIIIAVFLIGAITGAAITYALVRCDHDQPGPIAPSVAKTTEWKKRVDDIREKIPGKIAERRAIHAAGVAAVDSVKKLDSAGAVAACRLDTMSPQAICSEITAGRFYRAELGAADSVIHDQGDLIIALDSVVRYQGETIVNTTAALKRSETSSKRLIRGIKIGAAIVIIRTGVKIIFKL